MRILFVITGMGLGGAELQLCELMQRMTRLGHELHLAWLTGDAKVSIPTGVRQYPLKMQKNPASFIKTVWHLRALATHIKPDVVHAHMVHANILSRLVKLVSAKKIHLICTAHSPDEGGRFRNLAYRWTDRLADITTNVSEHAKNTFINKGASFPGRITTVPNGIDTTRFSPQPRIRENTRKSLGLDDKK